MKIFNVPENNTIVYALCIGIKDNKVFKQKVFYNNGIWYSEKGISLTGYCRIKCWNKNRIEKDYSISRDDLYDNAICLINHRKGYLLKDYLKELNKYIKNNSLDKIEFLNRIKQNPIYNKEIIYYIENYFNFPKSIMPNDFKV